MPCYRCGIRQTDPERGKSPWRRGVVQDQLVLICPACQELSSAELERCAKCRSAHLIRRLGQVECLDCGLVREAPDIARRPCPDAALADEVSRALDRLLGPSRLGPVPAGSAEVRDQPNHDVEDVMNAKVREVMTPGPTTARNRAKRRHRWRRRARKLERRSRHAFCSTGICASLIPSPGGV